MAVWSLATRTDHSTRPYLVDRCGVVMLLPGVDNYPDPCHMYPNYSGISFKTGTDDLAGSSLSSDDSQISMSGQGAQSRAGGYSSRATNGERP